MNALSQLGVATFELAGAAAMVRDVASALPCGFRAVMREGTDRGQMEQMLASAQTWRQRQGWPAWTWDSGHPLPKVGRADAFWSDLAVTVERPGTAAIVGFGDDDTGNPDFEPHWTCVERIGVDAVRLYDSDEYDTVLRSQTAVRPERGWEIEDCFVLRATPVAGRGENA